MNSTHDNSAAHAGIAGTTEILARYPEKRSAVMPLLHRAQAEHGFISDDTIQQVAQLTGVPAVDVLGVVTFYPMFRQSPAGRRQIRVCRTLSCALCGGYDTMTALENEFGIKRGETTADGSVSLEFVECLASCGTGPVVQVDHALYEQVTADKVPALAAKIRASLDDPHYAKHSIKPNTPEWNG
jgi:NADH-quinone oxidoreductase subunit E